jgi:apolipoprotein D and lipocalin family protein
MVRGDLSAGLTGAPSSSGSSPSNWSTSARISAPLVLLVLLCQLQGCFDSPVPLPLAAGVDLNSMYGAWYIVATIPNRFEKGMISPYDVYSKRADGDIREDFYCRRGKFEAPVKHVVVHDSVVPGTGNAHWLVEIFWPVKLPFLVLYTDPRYRYVLFGEDNRSFGWIYSRSPTIDETDYRMLLNHFGELGYDTAKFRRIIQFPWQIGLPGFWNDGIQ